MNEIGTPRFTADLCVNFTFRQGYVSGKLLFTHPFKLTSVAILWVRSGEFMVFSTVK